MKKSVFGVALLSGLAMNNAGAVTVYKNEGFTWKLKGDFQVQLRQKAGEDEDLFTDYDDAELKNSFIYDLGNGMKAFAQADYDIKKEKSEETYVGLDFGKTKLILGDTDLPSDDFGHEKQYEGSSFEDAFDSTASSSDDQVRLEFDFGASSLAVSTDVEKDEQAKIDVNFLAEVGNFDFGLAYQDYQAEDGGESIDTMGVALGTTLGSASVGIDYSENDDLEVLHLSSAFKLSKKTKLAVGYEMATEKEVDIDSWYINVTHKLNKKVSLLAEAHNTDEDNSDAGYLAGIRVKF